jgi:tetratricopeptide (TPR) repeat protein
LGPEHLDVATSLTNLASIYQAQGKYPEAEERYHWALAIQEKILGPEHLDVATSLTNLASIYQAQGKYPEAEEQHHRALAIKEKVLGSEHPDVVPNLNPTSTTSPGSIISEPWPSGKRLRGQRAW